MSCWIMVFLAINDLAAPYRTVTRKIYLSALVAILTASSGQVLAQTRELAGSGELLDGVAAIVDDGVVLKSELNMRIDVVVENMRLAQAEAPPEQRRPLPPLSVLEEQVLEQLVLRQIQLQRASRFGIAVTDEMLNQALSTMSTDLGLTLESLPAALASEGIDYAMYRQDTREQMVLDQLQQREVYGSIVISPREMELCLGRSSTSLAEDVDYDISHILVGLPSDATQEQATPSAPLLPTVPDNARPRCRRRRGPSH